MLGGDGARNRIGRVEEDNEEGVTLGADLGARGERLPEHALVLFEQRAIAGTELLDEARGAFDVREQEGDGALGQTRHASILRTAGRDQAA